MPRGSKPGERRGGRKRGTPNKVTQEIREVTQGLFDEGYWANVKTRISEGKLAPAVECRLLGYAFGEPKQQHEISGELQHAIKRVVHEHRQ